MLLAQVHAAYEAEFAGFIARSQVAEATRRAQLAGIRFTPYNSQPGL